MLEPIPFWGMIEVDLPVTSYAENRPNYIKEDMNISELSNKLADEVDIHVAMGGSHFFKEVSKILRQFSLAESIIKQQKLEIESILKFIDERGESGQLIIWKASQK